MSFWTPQTGPGNEPAMDEITISRPLSADEAVKRLQIGRVVVMFPLLAYLLGGAVLLVVIMVGFLTHWSIGWMLAGGLGLAALLGGAVALGLMLGNETFRRQVRYELGDSGVLTVAWGAAGAQVSSQNFQRTFRYQEIQWVREIDGDIVLRFAMQWHPSPYVLAFPPDFVPAQVRQRIAAAGAPTR